MVYPATYYLSQNGKDRRLKRYIVILVVIYGGLASFLLYRIFSRQFTWYNDASYLIWIGICLVMPSYWYNKTAKQLRDTHVEITDIGVTLFDSKNHSKYIAFADVKLVNKTGFGLVLVPNAQKGNKVIMITNRFDGYDEIEAKIDAAIAN